MAEALGRSMHWMVQKIGAGTLFGFSLLLALLSSISWWLNEFVGRSASLALGSIVLLALMLGWLLARSQISGWVALIFVTLAGLLSVPVLSGRLLGPLFGLSRAVISLGFSGRQWQSGQPLPDPTLTRLLAQDLGLRLAEMVQRVTIWIGALLHGVSGFDPLAAGLVWGFLLWGAAAWAAWGVRRRWQPLPAALPAMVILAASLAFARGPLLYLVVSCGLVLGLVAWSQYTCQVMGWQRHGVDYITDIPFDLTLWTGSIVVVVSVIAVVAATPSPHQVLRSARSLLVPRSQAAESLGESLGLSPGAGEVQPGRAVSVLPRQRLLGSGPELGQRVVYLIQVVDQAEVSGQAGDNDQPEYGQFYWRAATYDVYDGRGWMSSPTTAVRYLGGEGPPLPAQPGGYHWVEQEVQVMEDAGVQVVQAGELFRMDQAFHVDLRTAPPGELDAFGARLQRLPSAGGYHVVSRLPAPSESELVELNFDYPLWITERYLLLPDNLPLRTQDLAQEIAAGAATPYSRARRIETYLRALPYTLDLPAPPPDRDVVDYFLFDLRRGYCDYYASAMVVLARTLGLPSRLVVGYAPGHYDASSDRTVITEADAHSWPEIYFSGIGWVAFEPTGGRPLRALPEAQTSPSTDEPVALLPSPVSPFPGDKALVALVASAIVVLLIWGGLRWRSAQRSGVAILTSIYKDLRKSGRSLGAPDWPGLTPSEVADLVGVQVERLARPGRQNAVFFPASSEAVRLAELYARAIYSPDAPDAASVDAARRLWQRLRWRLWLVWLRSRARVR